MSRVVRIVSLWIHHGKEAAFEAFERGAAIRMAAHGGRIDAAVRTSPTGLATDTEGTVPFEIHMVSFPSKAAADAYAIDPENQARAENRAAIIARTEVSVGIEAGPY